MQIRELHPWNLDPREAVKLQRHLANLVSRENQIGEVRTVAGVDVSVGRRGSEGRAAVVVVSYPDLNLVETAIAEAEITYPYIPGLLSFREVPIVLDAFRKLNSTPDLVMVDGQGLAHPRRFGIACHLGVILDLPTIGCAKSRLIGEHGDLTPQAGGWALLSDHGETVGAVVRTRTNVNPMFISIGHKVDLDAAIRWTLACCRGYRLPQPTRLAHQAAGDQL